MADRKDLLLLGSAFELDFRRLEDADVLYKNYLFAHPFYDRFKVIMGSPSKALQEIENAFKSEATHLSIAFEFDRMLTELEWLYAFYGVDKFRRQMKDITISYNNRDAISKRFHREGGTK